MGQSKRVLEEAERAGFSPSGDVVCIRHAIDEFLVGHLRAVEGASECVVCHDTELAHASLDALLEIVVAVIGCYRWRAIDHLFHDAESESGYAISDSRIADTPDTVSNLFAGAVDDELLEYLSYAIEDELWFDPSALWFRDAELYLHSWDDFRRLALAETPSLGDLLEGRLDPERWSHPDADGIRPSNVLPDLFDLIADTEAITEIPLSTTWYRVVEVAPEELLTASRLGTAPHARSTENRMNKAGAPMFYGAGDIRTARAEVGEPAEGRQLAFGLWKPSRPLRVLDVAQTFELPSLYDVERAAMRWRLQFLEGFASDVGKKVDQDNVGEYRATQLLVEFMRDRHPDVDGIVYRSSRTGQVCCAVKVENEHCIEAGEERPAEELALILTESGRLVRSGQV